jgi:hypothetical protein
MPLPREGYMAGIVDETLVIAGGNYWDRGEKRWTARVDIFDPMIVLWQPSVPQCPCRKAMQVLRLSEARSISSVA